MRSRIILSLLGLLVVAVIAVCISRPFTAMPSPFDAEAGNASQQVGNVIRLSETTDAVRKEPTAERHRESVTLHDVTVLSISDHRGEPAVGAAGSVATTRGAKPAFTVPEDGLVELVASEVSSAVIGIKHEGCALFTLRLPNDPQPLYEIFLSEGVAISGRVSMADQEPVPEEARVFVWEEGAEMSLGAAAPVYSSFGGRYSVDIGDDGAFHASGLREGARYGVSVYGAGIVALATNEIRAITAPSGNHLLVAHYLYGAQIVPDSDSAILSRMAEKLSLWAPSGLVGRQEGFHVLDSVRYDLVRHNSWGVTLAGLARPSLLRSVLPRAIFLGMESRQLQSVAAEVQLFFPCLGLSTLRFNLKPLDGNGRLEEIVFASSSMPLGMGSISLDLGYPGSHFDLPGIRRIPPQVRLEAVRPNDCLETGEQLSLNAEWLQEKGCYIVDCVPAGEYLARLVLVEANTYIPRAQDPGHFVKVEAGGNTDISLEPPPLGTLHIDTAHGPSGKYSGAARVLVGKLSGEVGHSGEYSITVLNPDEHTFERPPYEMGPFPVGEYYIRCYISGGIAAPPGPTPMLRPFLVTIERGVNLVEIDLVETGPR